MNRFILISFVLWLAGTIARAQDSLHIQASWRRGDVRNLHITHTQETSTDGQKTQNETRYLIRMQVLDSSATGYRLKCTYQAIKIIKPDPRKMNPLSRALLKMVDGMQIIISTRPDGSFRSLDNFGAISAHLDSMVDVIMAAANRQGASRQPA